MAKLSPGNVMKITAFPGGCVYDSFWVMQKVESQSGKIVERSSKCGARAATVLKLLYNMRFP
jgi:hypothetical protein